MNSVLDYLQRFGSNELDRVADRELLRRFATQRDEGAFATLVRRHGPLVLSVCHRVLGHSPDAEDAFQAAFLVLARKAGAIEWQESIASWLHEVACRVAAEARGKIIRGRMRETIMNAIPDVPDPSAGRDPELAAVLDEEMRRLPEHYRTPLLLCCLEGRSREEAAQMMGCSSGTIKGRLERGRRLLADRLARRGIGVASIAGLTLSPAVVGATLVGKTTKLAGSFAAGSAFAGGTAVRLAEIVLRTMARSRLALIGAAVLALLTTATAAVVLMPQPQPKKPPVEAIVTAPAPEPRPPAPKSELVIEHGKPIRVSAFSPDGKQVATASFDGTVRLSDASTGKAIREWKVEGLNSALAISPNGQLLAAGNDRGELIAWDITTGKERFGRMTRQKNVYHLAFSPDGSLLVSANHAGTISLFDSTTGANLMNLVGHNGRVWWVAFAPDGQTLASSGADGTVRLWDPLAGRERSKFRAHEAFACATRFSADGKLLVSVGYDGVLRMWDAHTLKEIRTIGVPPSPALAISPDGKTLATTDREGGLHLWETATGKKLHSAKKHNAQTHHVAFSPDGRRLVTSSEDKKAQLWTLETNE